MKKVTKKPVKEKILNPHVILNPDKLSIRVFDSDKLTVHIVAPNVEIYNMAAYALKKSDVSAGKKTK